MATFAVIFGTAIGVGTTVGFATCPLLGILAGVLAAVVTGLLLALIYRVALVRRVVMGLMHRITRQ
jgi:hypothetical protein